MNRSTRSFVLAIGLSSTAVLTASACFAQTSQPAQATASATSPYRKLAPDVLETITPVPEHRETFSRHDVVELLAVDPNFQWAKDVAFRRDIWHLEFKFKPVRMLWVDVPQNTGVMKRTLVWYLIYNVTNPGKVLHPVEDEDGTYTVEAVDKPIRFIPEFLLESPEFNKAYPDRVIPIALGPIRLREDPRRTFLTAVEMATQEINVGETVWGVAMWEAVDPQIDRFALCVGGLTNAYKWKDDAGAVKPGSPIGTGRRLARKTLKLNFWRPGDEYYQHEGEIRYGIPGEVDYEWVYR